MRKQSQYTYHEPRQDWKEALRVAGPSQNRALSLGPWLENEFDREEWEWQSVRRTKVKNAHTAKWSSRRCPTSAI